MPQLASAVRVLPHRKLLFWYVANEQDWPMYSDAIQIEFGSNYRKPKEKLADTADKAAEAIEKFYRAYFVPAKK